MKISKFSLFFILPFLFSNSVAAEDTIIFEAKEIENLQVLEERAEKGITDLEETPYNIKDEVNNSEKAKSEEELEIIETTQKLEAVENEDNEIVTSYATTVFTDVPIDETEEKEVDELSFFLLDYKKILKSFSVQKAYADGNQSDSTSGSFVRSYSTIYWKDRVTSAGREYRLDEVKGGWTRLDGTVSMTNRVVRLGQMASSGTVSKTYNPTANTFRYSAPTTWSWANRNCSACFVGVHTSITIKRGTAPATVQKLPNHLYGYPVR